MGTYREFEHGLDRNSNESIKEEAHDDENCEEQQCLQTLPEDKYGILLGKKDVTQSLTPTPRISNQEMGMKSVNERIHAMKQVSE